MNRSNKRIFMAAAVLFLAATPAPAAPIALDSFNYGLTGAPLSGDNGGTGFSGPWIAGGLKAANSLNYTIANGSLSYPGTTTIGNSVTTNSLSSIGGITRGLTNSLGSAGTTAYLSFIVLPEGALDQGAFNGFFGLYLNASTGNDLFVGKPGAGSVDNFVLEDRGGASQHSSGVFTSIGNSFLMVVRADFTAGNDTFTLYVNPQRGREPIGGTAKNDSDVGTITGTTIYSTGAFSIDELRLGTTYADVAPVPEPSGLILLAIGASMALSIANRTPFRLFTELRQGIGAALPR